MERDQYYSQRSSFTYLERWRSLIKGGHVNEAITYWKTYRLRGIKDCYVKLKANSWVPPLYYCCLSASYGEMVKVLLKMGADPDQLPDSDTLSYLPFVCHSLYLRTLAQKHQGGPYERGEILDRSIDGRLNSGAAHRLMHLITLGLLETDAVRSYVGDQRDSLIVDKLQVMIKYLTFCYNMRSQTDTEGTLNLTTETHRVVDKFRVTVKFLIDHGAPVTESTIEFCIDHYLFEILPVLGAGAGAGAFPVPKYHTQMDSTRVAILRPLLNDKRYVDICAVTGHEPDPDVHNCNIMA
jgi:hypothetical protein